MWYLGSVPHQPDVVAGSPAVAGTARTDVEADIEADIAGAAD